MFCVIPLDSCLMNIDDRCGLNRMVLLLTWMMFLVRLRINRVVRRKWIYEFMPITNMKVT